MSKLKTKAEDLLAAKTNDARAIARSTMAQDKDDLVSDKDRQKDDGGASSAIDTALKSGEVHQESLTDVILNDRLREVLSDFKASKVVEAKELNDKAFLNKSEQMAFAHYIARKDLKNPMSGSPMMDDMEMLSISHQAGDFKHLSDIMSETSVQMGLSSDESYMKALGKAMDTAMGLDSKSPELLMWRTVTSRLQPVV